MRRKTSDLILAGLTWGAALSTLGVLVFIIGYILFKGIPHIKLSLFEMEYNSENVSLMPAVISTLAMSIVSLAVVVPFGIFSAIYLVEYAKRGSKVVMMVRMTTETLSGIPSIVYGLFGLLFFVGYLGWGFSLLSGAFTLAIMVLPLVMRTTEEALKSVPDSFREGSFGLGAGKLRTIFRIILPSAIPGILAGVILAEGRIVGETAALIYTSGTVAQIPESLMQSARTMSVHMYALSSEGLYTNEAFATAVVLLVVVVGINIFAEIVARKLMRDR